jgi:hypothetical protein
MSAAETEELPEGWAECEIGDIAEVIGGGTPKANEPWPAPQKLVQRLW